ncbi:hypothetical protein T4C_67 [Trichinella pseudospiralis]|uniref:Uncharacterized protein n=1 Tax=Trichinella pseudospiralis TaxID=6337 RepID=A0A0V1K438_TRIPS|nr:hypothetical protein T4C_67 [Trichinella pseudospiralis]
MNIMGTKTFVQLTNQAFGQQDPHFKAPCSHKKLALFEIHTCKGKVNGAKKVKTRMTRSKSRTVLRRTRDEKR